MSIFESVGVRASRHDASFCLLGKRYWSEQMTPFAGQWVIAFVPPRGSQTVKVIGPDGREYLAKLIEEDSTERPLADREVARSIRDRFRVSPLEREESARCHASIVRRQAEILLQLIDERIRSERLIHQPLRQRLVAKFFGFLMDRFGQTGKAGTQATQNRDLKQVRDLGLHLQLAEAIFMHPQTVFDAQLQRPSPEISTASDAISAAGSLHRLSGDQN